MFRTEIRDDYSFMGWLVQQFAAIMVPVAWALITVEFPVNLGQWFGYPVGNIFEVLWYAVFVWGIGFFLALLVYRFSPRAAVEGRWVWVVPMFFFLLAFIGVALLSSLRHALSQFFWPESVSEDWWAFATYPTCSATLYSLAMFFASRRTRLRTVRTSAAPIEN